MYIILWYKDRDFSVTCKPSTTVKGSVLSRHLWGNFPHSIETSPQEFSATPAVKLKIMSILDWHLLLNVSCLNFIKYVGQLLQSFNLKRPTKVWWNADCLLFAESNCWIRYSWLDIVESFRIVIWVGHNFLCREHIWLSAKKQLRSVRSALSFFKIILVLSQNPQTANTFPPMLAIPPQT